MSKIHLLRMFLNDRLAAFAEEIFGEVERTIAEYQEEVSRSKEEIGQLRMVMGKVPEIMLYGSDLPQFIVSEEPVPAELQPSEQRCNVIPGTEQQQQPPEQRCDPSMEQQLLLPAIKEEPEEFWTTQGDAVLPGLEEALMEDCHDPEMAYCLRNVHFKEDRDTLPSSSTVGHMNESNGETYKVTEITCDFESLSPVVNPALFAPMEYTEDGRKSGKTQADVTVLKSLNHPMVKRESSRLRLKEPHLNAPSHVPCKICGQAFGSNSCSEQLKHVRKHSKDMRCARCVWGECFEDTGSMVDQLPSHRGDSFCDFCGKCFKGGAALKTHMRIHTGEKPFQCTYCGKRFNQLGNLVGHTRIHTGEKPYPCDVCGKRFRGSNDMKRHMRRIHRKEPL